jgi:heme iron utilization protein
MISRREDETPVTPSSVASEEPAWAARLLLRSARAASLATLREGVPFLSLVTPATAPDLSVLMLLSSLSEHRRNLEADGRCALMVTGAAETRNPQTAPRLTLSGRAAEVTGEEMAGLKARWLAAHPYAAFYADFADFALFRFVAEEAQYIGGFARAYHLALDQLLPSADGVAAVASAEARILAHCNADHAEALLAIALASGGDHGDWRMTAVDVDGFDLAADDHVFRRAFSRPVASSSEVRQELVRLVDAAGSGMSSA